MDGFNGKLGILFISGKNPSKKIRERLPGVSLNVLMNIYATGLHHLFPNFAASMREGHT